MHLSLWAIAALFFLSACTPPPVVESPPEVTPVPPAEVAPVEEPAAPVGDFSEATPRGTALITTQDTFAAPNSSLLEDVLSYAAQGDQAAVSAMVDGNFPKAHSFPAGAQLVFEGCDYPADTCHTVKAREQGSDRELVFRVEDLAVDRR